MWFTIIQSTLCGLMHRAVFIMLARISVSFFSLCLYLYDNGKWKMLQNEVGLLGQLSFLWMMQAWGLLERNI